MSSILEGQVSHTVSFSRSDLNFTKVKAEDGNFYEKVSIPDLSQTNEAGKPCLPVKYVRLIVPSDQDVESVILKTIKKVQLLGSHLIYPAQPDMPISSDYQKLVLFVQSFRFTDRINPTLQKPSRWFTKAILTVTTTLSLWRFIPFSIGQNRVV